MFLKPRNKISLSYAYEREREVILEKKVTEELEKFLEKIENKTIVTEPTTTAISLVRKLRKKNKVSSLR
ncbi:MAG: hypothetical protein DRO98_04645 [Archaeoglobales archaeon]|nr:MAG: hypothetical protein DRO98_04645 [Archaeoglobales archaeon]